MPTLIVGNGPGEFATIQAAIGAAGVDGVEISGSYDTTGTPDITAPPRIGLLIGPADVTIENSVLTGDAFNSRPFGTFGAAFFVAPAPRFS